MPWLEHGSCRLALGGPEYGEIPTSGRTAQTGQNLPETMKMSWKVDQSGGTMRSLN